jgi:hypothetical protein
MKGITMKQKLAALPALYLTFKKFDDKGNEIFHQEEEGHSWVRNGWNFQFLVMAWNKGTGTAGFGAGNMNLQPEAGPLSGAGGINGELQIDGSTGFSVQAIGSDSGGVYVGTSNAAFSAEHTTLQGKITHGTGTGNFMYGANATPTPTYDTPTKTWTMKISRDFTNSSGGSITVAEIGLFLRAEILTTATYQYMLARDVLGTPVDVADGEILRVTYELSSDFSAID